MRTQTLDSIERQHGIAWRFETPQPAFCIGLVTGGRNVKLEILIDIDNDAFLYADGTLANLLSQVGIAAQEIEGAKDSTSIRDPNGNTVGHWRITAN